LLTVAQVAAVLRLDRRTVAAAIRAGQLPAVVISARVYVPAAKLREWLGLPPLAAIVERPSRVRFGDSRAREY
jgi:excisionase family DNA binding protein